MLYTENETMKFIGEQNALVCSADGEFAKEIEDVINAHFKHTFPHKGIIFEIGMDFFLLGFALGKREARKAKNQKKWLF